MTGKNSPPHYIQVPPEVLAQQWTVRYSAFVEPIKEEEEEQEPIINRRIIEDP